MTPLLKNAFLLNVDLSQVVSSMNGNDVKIMSTKQFTISALQTDNLCIYSARLSQLCKAELA